MIRRSRVVGAALGLLLLAAPFGTGAVRAQTSSDFTPPPECSDPPPAEVEDGISATVVSPTGTEPRTSPNVPVEATFTNESRRPVVNQPNGQIAELRAFVFACEPGLVVPTAPDPVQPAGDPRTASIAWSAEFPTNGRFVIVLEADGTSVNPDDTQSARVVVPVRLAVPPKKPTNVDVSEPDNGVVAVSWDYADPEPDLFGFEIRRARQGTSEYTTIKNGAVGPKARSVSDSPPVGAWRYQVVAYRRGAPEGAVSRDATVEVAEAAPPTSVAGGSTTGSTTPGAGSGTDADGSTTTVAGAPSGSSGAPRSSVDLSDFAATLNARRAAPARIEPPDPGFGQTLPFDTSADLEAEEEEAPQELGADEPNVGLGQQPVSDPGERRRSLGFVAFGLLLFVLSLTGLFVKSEVKRADLLDLVAVPDGDHSDGGVEGSTPQVVAAAATRAARRRRRTAAPPPTAADAPAVASGRRARRASGDAFRELSPTAVVPPRPGDVAAVVTRRAARRNRSALEFPESRRQRTTPAEAPAHDFDDLVTAAAPERARRAPAPAAPLDAPGLDVPDPTPAPVRARRNGAAKPKSVTLPNRRPSHSGRR